MANNFVGIPSPITNTYELDYLTNRHGRYGYHCMLAVVEPIVRNTLSHHDVILSPQDHVSINGLEETTNHTVQVDFIAERSEYSCIIG